MAQSKNPRVVTPVGIAKFCWVMPDKPDTGWDGKSDPHYKTRILIDDTPENREWMESVMEQGAAFAKQEGIKLKKKFNTPFKLPEDQDEDDYIPAEGKDRPKLDEDHKDRIFFEAKSKYPPGLIDTARESLPEDVKVMGGDKIRLKVELNPYEGLGSGISFRLKTVQLVEKNSNFSGGGGVDTDGFDDVEGGYVAGGNNDDDEDF